MTLHDIVERLAGPIEAVGKTEVDAQRLKNLADVIKLTDQLVFDISQAAKDKDRQEASMSEIGKKAHKFLVDLKESLADET